MKPGGNFGYQHLRLRFRNRTLVQAFFAVDRAFLLGHGMIRPGGCSFPPWLVESVVERGGSVPRIWITGFFPKGAEMTGGALLSRNDPPKDLKHALNPRLRSGLAL